MSGTVVAPDTGAILNLAEAEGVTLVLPSDRAAALGLVAVLSCRRVVLAVITAALARARIGVNPVAGFRHDRLSVPEARAEEAMAVLERLARGPRG